MKRVAADRRSSSLALAFLAFTFVNASWLAPQPGRPVPA